MAWIHSKQGWRASRVFALAVAIVFATASGTYSRPFALGLSTDKTVTSDWSINTRAPAGNNFQVVELQREGGIPVVELRWVASSEPSPGEFVALAQLLDAAEYRGKRVRLQAIARAARDKPGRAGLVLRVDGPERSTLFFDNMADRPIRSEDWAAYAIEANVPAEAVKIYVGLLASGEADVSFSDVSMRAVGNTLPTSPDAIAYLDRAMDLIQKHHLRSAEADWPGLRREALIAIAGAQTSREAYPGIRLVLSRLGERHSGLLPPPTEAAPSEQPQTWPSASQRGGVGVLRVTPLSTAGRNGASAAGAYTKMLREETEHLKQKGVCGWVVDLRSNSGGNMWPMLNGLRPILGEPPFGAFISRSGDVSSWVEQGGVVAEERNLSGPAKSSPSTRQSLPPVAVLIGPQTASSGEMVAVALHGREKTHFFGAPTAGLVTSNETYRLSDGALLLVTAGLVKDRAGNAYSAPILPDVLASPAEGEGAAMRWLSSEGCH